MEAKYRTEFSLQKTLLITHQNFSGVGLQPMPQVSNSIRETAFGPFSKTSNHANYCTNKKPAFFFKPNVYPGQQSDYSIRATFSNQQGQNRLLFITMFLHVNLTVSQFTLKKFINVINDGLTMTPHDTDILIVCGSFNDFPRAMMITGMKVRT